LLAYLTGRVCAFVTETDRRPSDFEIVRRMIEVQENALARATRTQSRRRSDATRSSVIRAGGAE